MLIFFIWCKCSVNVCGSYTADNAEAKIFVDKVSSFGNRTFQCFFNSNNGDEVILDNSPTFSFYCHILLLCVSVVLLMALIIFNCKWAITSARCPLTGRSEPAVEHRDSIDGDERIATPRQPAPPDYDVALTMPKPRLSDQVRFVVDGQEGFVRTFRMSEVDNENSPPPSYRSLENPATLGNSQILSDESHQTVSDGRPPSSVSPTTTNDSQTPAHWSPATVIDTHSQSNGPFMGDTDYPSQATAAEMNGPD